jgi:hypothetical protein
VIRAHQVDRFIDAYAPALEVAVAEHPEEYGFKPDVVDTVVERMRHAFYEGSYNHDGRAIKAACKKLGIPHTRTAMEKFFNTNPEAVTT